MGVEDADDDDEPDTPVLTRRPDAFAKDLHAMKTKAKARATANKEAMKAKKMKKQGQETSQTKPPTDKEEPHEGHPKPPTAPRDWPPVEEAQMSHQAPASTRKVKFV